MISTSTANRLTDFGPLSGGHELSIELEALLARAASDPVLVGGGPDAAGPLEIRRCLRVTLRASIPEIVRFYWCAKWHDGDGRFHAHTFVHAPRQRPTRTYDFPEDPWLPAAAAALGPLDADDVAVLRYIPTRRITFRRGDALVGKIKRPRSIERSYANLHAVHAAAGGAGFAVPAPMGLDTDRGVFYQQRMPGRPIADMLDAANAAALMHGVGALHAAVHRLAVRGVPERPVSRHVAAVRRDAAWVAFALPAEAGAVAEVERRIVSDLDTLGPGRPAFCHGDPALDQVLFDGERFAVVDFDDAGIGDPYADVGTMVASLGIDARRLAGGARAAYLDGYREAAGRPLDERRLRAHVLRARLTMLASRLRKGRLDTAAAVDAVGRLRAAARER